MVESICALRHFGFTHWASPECFSSVLPQPLGHLNPSLGSITHGHKLIQMATIVISPPTCRDPLRAFQYIRVAYRWSEHAATRERAFAGDMDAHVSRPPRPVYRFNANLLFHGCLERGSAAAAVGNGVSGRLLVFWNAAIRHARSRFCWDLNLNPPSGFRNPGRYLRTLHRPADVGDCNITIKKPDLHHRRFSVCCHGTPRRRQR